MSNRRLVVEFAPGFTPFSSSYTWVDLSNRLQEASWTVGREDEFEHFSPGTATVLLKNYDRFLDADNVAGPWFGQLDPYVPVRIRSQNLSTLAFEDEFYGFVTSGFEQQLAPIGSGHCKLELVDLLGVLGGYKLPDVFHQAILDYSPVGFWVLDGGGNTDAEQVPDLGSGKNDGAVIGEGVQLGDKPVVPGHTAAANFTVAVDATTGETTYGNVELTRSVILSNFNSAVLVVTFIARTKASNTWRVLFTHGTGTAFATLAGSTGFQAHIDTAGKLRFRHQIHGVGTTYITADEIVGKPGLSPATTGHIAFLGANAGIAVDTTTFSTGTTTGGIGNKNGSAIGGGNGIAPQNHFDGWIGTVALFSSLTSQGRTDIFTGYTKLAGQRSDQHIGWALDQLNVPSGRRNLDVGTVFMGAADTNERDALEFMREVTATEGGGLYVDHRDGGKIRFVNRYSRHLATRSVTSQATFTDDPSANADVSIRYMPEGLEIAPNGLDGIINQVTVTWRDGQVIVEDAASITSYGPRSRQLDTTATTANAARSAGEWILANYAQPRSRVRGATASKGTFGDRHDKVQDLRIGDRVTFRVHPQKLGAATTSTLFVDGVSHVCAGPEWRTSFRFAPGYTFQPWVWGTSSWNTTKFWG